MKKIFLLVLALSSFISPGFSEPLGGKEKFPFVAQVVSDGANVRAGQNINFEKLCRLKKGDQLVVVGRNYNWYKIKLPEQVSGYLRQDYLQLEHYDVGVVNANNLNIRAGAGVNFSSLGRLAKGSKVKIRGKNGEWFQIEPPEGSVGWIEASLVVFHSSTIPPPKVVETTSRRLYPRTNPEEPPPAAQEALLRASGQLESVETLPTLVPFTYQLVANGKAVYYLQGPKNIFENFIHHKVKIEGTPQADLTRRYSLPVVNVTKIELIL